MLAWSQSKTNTDYKQALQDAMPSAPVRTDKYRDAIIRLSQDVAPTRTTPWRSYMKALFSAVAQSDEAVVIVVYLSGGDAVTGTFSLNCPLSSTLPRTFWVHDLESDTRFELDLDGVIHYAVLANGMNTV